MRSAFETGSYLRPMDFVYHSSLGLRVIRKKRRGRGRNRGDAAAQNRLDREIRPQRSHDQGHDHLPRKHIRLPEKGNSSSHGARPVHQIITMIKWIRTRRLSIHNSL